MFGYKRDLWVWALLGILAAAHVDFWAWNKIHPFLFGWIPYPLWYDGLLTISGALFFLWWGKRGWPNPPESVER